MLEDRTGALQDAVRSAESLDWAPAVCEMWSVASQQRRSIWTISPFFMFLDSECCVHTWGSNAGSGRISRRSLSKVLVYQGGKKKFFKIPTPCGKLPWCLSWQLAPPCTLPRAPGPRLSGRKLALSVLEDHTVLEKMEKETDLGLPGCLLRS